MMTKRTLLVLITTMSSMFIFCVVMINALQEEADIYEFPIDLIPPKMQGGEPSPGKHVKQTAREFHNTKVYHTLYLPTDWQPNKTYPVIVEYAGNGPYSNKYGDVNSGYVEDCNMGYGISGGEGMIWVCMPYISENHQSNQRQWWGDADATAEYCYTNVLRICDEYGGDRSQLIVVGFSRGAIACNYIGLRNDKIASLWKAFIAHSHYDGVYQWQYADSDRDSAIKRLQRLDGRPQWISHELSLDDTKEFIESTGIKAQFHFMPLPYRNHTDTWVLRNIPERKQLREWLTTVLNQ